MKRVLPLNYKPQLKLQGKSPCPVPRLADFNLLGSESPPPARRAHVGYPLGVLILLDTLGTPVLGDAASPGCPRTTCSSELFQLKVVSETQHGVLNLYMSYFIQGTKNMITVLKG